MTEVKAAHFSASFAQFKLFSGRGDKWKMKRMILGFLILSLLVPSGCMVLDELDSSNAKMTGGSQAKADAVPESVPAAKPTKNQLLEQSKEWWNEATSLTPKAVDSSVVSCRLDGNTHFMSKDDCLIRGGVPKGVSG